MPLWEAAAMPAKGKYLLNDQELKNETLYRRFSCMSQYQPLVLLLGLSMLSCAVLLIVFFALQLVSIHILSALVERPKETRLCLQILHCFIQVWINNFTPLNIKLKSIVAMKELNLNVSIFFRLTLRQRLFQVSEMCLDVGWEVFVVCFGALAVHMGQGSTRWQLAQGEVLTFVFLSYFPHF